MVFGIYTGVLMCWQGLLSVLRYMLQADKRRAIDYRVVVNAKETEGKGDSSKRAPRAGRRAANAASSDIILNFWCLNAAVAFEAVAADAHSVLLCSGTLAPLASFAGNPPIVYIHKWLVPLCSGTLATLALFLYPQKVAMLHKILLYLINKVEAVLR